MKNNTDEIRVVELFAGVGGFRIGLEGYGKKKRKGYRTVWSNQWEPSTNKQHASEVYTAQFGADGHSNVDISKVLTKDIPDHDLLVGGFPCQDYSVARTLSQAEGLHGKKGVLWWEIYRILKEKGKKAPSYLFLENVDRLLRSPVKEKGRDFAIMLSSLAELGYTVEWRVINAAEYGKPQRRKRTFIMGYKKGTSLDKELRSHRLNPLAWMLKDGVIATGFPVNKETKSTCTNYDIGKNALNISSAFPKLFPNNIHFFNTGIMIDGKVSTVQTTPNYSGKKITLGDIILSDGEVDKDYFIPKSDLERWKYLKGPKREPRTTKGGFEYIYTEGGMHYPDRLTEASRTIITAEGGSTPSRFKHVIKTKKGLRRLTPTELELLCQFPKDHTNIEGISDNRRAFFMGNALVVGVIEDMGTALLKKIKGLSKKSK